MTIAKDDSPCIYVVAGSPAAGKTRFVNRGLQNGLFPSDAVIHDCDSLMCNMPEYLYLSERFGARIAFEKLESPARKKSEALLARAIEAKKTIVYDRSCGLPSSYFFLKNLVERNRYGLIVHALYVDLNRAVQRAEARERENGRHFPPSLIRERSGMFSALWPHYLALSEKAFLYDSRDTGVDLIASGSCKQWEIRDMILYREFLSRGKGYKKKIDSLLNLRG